MIGTTHIGRIGALAVALGIGFAAAPAPTAAASDPPPDTTALIVCGTTCPTPDDWVVNAVMRQLIGPTHPGAITPVKVTTPEELWPLTGAGRLLLLAVAPPELGGLGGPAWPDEPLWKLSGLFDRTANQSLMKGADDLEHAIADNPNQHVVIFGYSQGAGVANVVKKRLAEQYPEGTEAPDIDFVLLGDPNLPNGGLMSRFAGLYIPILDFPFNGPAATDTQFDTVEVVQQYDGFTDFPLYPLNVVADLNAIMGIAYVHTYLLDNSLASDASGPAPIKTTHGDTTYYFFESENLPLFAPLRAVGVPEPVIDVFEPFVREVVELGYDRSIPIWQPTPARLVPRINPVTAAGDFADAISEGIDNARALVKPRPPVKTSSTSAELLTNESVGAEQSAQSGGTALVAQGRTSDSTSPLGARARPTPVRDAVKNITGSIKAVVADVKKAIRKDRPDVDKAAQHDEPASANASQD